MEQKNEEIEVHLDQSNLLTVEEAPHDDYFGSTAVEVQIFFLRSSQNNC